MSNRKTSTWRNVDAKMVFVAIIMLMITLQYATVFSPASDIIDVVGAEEIRREEALIYTHTPRENSDNWNPYNVVSQISSACLRGTACEFLFYYNFDNDTFIPWTATGYEYSSDLRTLTIKIRKGVTWNDGKPFTSRDVAFTLRMLIHDPSCSHPDIVSGIQGFNRSDPSKAAIKTPDDYTVQITYKEPNPHAHWDFTCVVLFGLYIVPEHIYGPATTAGTGTVKPSQFVDNKYVWTGPFKVYDTTDPNRIILRRDDNWWGAKTGFCKLPEVKWVIHQNFGTTEKAQLALVNNELDHGGGKYSVYEALLKQNPKLYWWQHLDPCPRILYANLYKYPTNNRHVRHAIAKVIDQEKIARVAFDGRCDKAQWVQPTYKSIQKFLPTDWLETATDSFVAVAGPNKGKTITYKLDPSIHNHTEAAMILEGLGWTKRDGIWYTENGTRTSWFVNNMHTWDLAAPQVIIEELREFGFDATLGMLAWSPALEKLETNDYDLTICWIQQPVHPGDPFIWWSKLYGPDTEPLYDEQGKRIRVSWFRNCQRYKNQTFDDLYVKLRGLVPDSPEAIAVEKQMFMINTMDMPMIPIFQVKQSGIANQKYWVDWPSSGDPANPKEDLLYAYPGSYLGQGLFVLLRLKHSPEFRPTPTPSPTPSPTPTPTVTPTPTPKPTVTPTPSPTPTPAGIEPMIYVAVIVVAVVAAGGYVMMRRKPKK